MRTKSQGATNIGGGNLILNPEMPLTPELLVQTTARWTSGGNRPGGGNGSKGK
jgi:hypothetical protein